MRKKYLSEMVGDSYLEWGERKRIILITAHTGSGKTYFSIRVLMVYCIGKGGKIAYIGNRRILLDQVVEQVWGEELRQGIKRGVIRCFTYQELEQDGKRAAKCWEYIASSSFVVVDEAAYFTLDSSFSGTVEKSFRKLMSLVGKTCLIFMTATPERLKKLLDRQMETLNRDIRSEWEARKQEREKAMFSDYFLKHGGKKGRLCDYMAAYEYYEQNEVERMEYEVDEPNRVGYVEVGEPADYSYITLYFYQGSDELISIIARAAPREKFLIVQNSKAANENLKKELLLELEEADRDRQFKRSVITVSAEYREDDGMKEVVDEIVENEKLSHSVVIATICMDNGITITDPALKNIVVAGGLLRDELIQVIGRKRVSGDERINVYVDLCSAQVFDERCREYQKCYKRMRPVYASEGLSLKEVVFDNRIPYGLAEKFTYEDNGTLYWSDLGLFVLSENYRDNEEMHGAMEKDPYAYAKAVCDFLGKSFSEDKLVETISMEERKESMAELVDGVVGTFIPKKQYNSLAKKITEMAGRNPSTDCGTVKSVLEEHGIRLEPFSMEVGKKTFYWFSEDGKFPLGLRDEIRSYAELKDMADRAGSVLELFQSLFDEQDIPDAFEGLELTFINESLKYLEHGYGYFRKNKGKISCISK